jgi:hypothetical protein
MESTVMQLGRDVTGPLVSQRFRTRSFQNEIRT